MRKCQDPEVCGGACEGSGRPCGSKPTDTFPAPHPKLVDPRRGDQQRFQDRGPHAIEIQLDHHRKLLGEIQKALIECDFVVIPAQQLADLMTKVVKISTESALDPTDSSNRRVDPVATVQQWMNAPLDNQDPTIVFVDDTHKIMDALESTTVDRPKSTKSNALAEEPAVASSAHPRLQ